MQCKTCMHWWPEQWPVEDMENDGCAVASEQAVSPMASYGYLLAENMARAKAGSCPHYATAGDPRPGADAG